ncbi:MAG: protein-S-isoprenylcysteine O-methyltransferase Ste14 [Marinomonas primoryensis]|jgi:protein-S-isoprenylcysteine O-methyltransferase Ste14
MPVTTSNFSVAFLWRKRLPQKINYKAPLFEALDFKGIIMQTLELKIPPVVQVLVTASLMWTLAVAVPSFGFTLSVSSLVAIVFAAIGVAFALRGVLEFRSAGTTVDPRVPDQFVSLVICGVYRISRNPMYAGFLLVLIAWGMFLSNLASFVLLPAFVIYMNRFQIAPEELHMREKFGEAYREYEAEVRKWF